MQRKAAKDAQDADIAREKLRLEQERIQVEKDKIGVDAHLRTAQIEASMRNKGE